MSEIKHCSICENGFTEYGNNPEPFDGETCCDHCNNHFVVPVRLVFGRDGDKAPLKLFARIAALGAMMENTQREAKKLWEEHQAQKGINNVTNIR